MAQFIVVMWSPNSVKSHWVIDEAEYARDNRKFIPNLIDHVKPPLGFRQFHFADLSKWNGQDNDPQ